MKRANLKILSVPMLLLIFALGVLIWFVLSQPLPPPGLRHAANAQPDVSKPDRLRNLPVMPHGVTQQMIDELNLHAVITKDDFWAFVMYRRGDKLYWTKTRHLIKAGTLLYCDDVGRDGFWKHNCYIAACGNMISLTPEQPVAPNDEPIDDGLVMPGQPIPGEPFVPPYLPPTSGPVPPTPPTYPPSYPPDYPPVVFCCGGGGGNTPVTPVPEPGTLMLTLSGGLFLAYGWLRWGKGKKS